MNLCWWHTMLKWSNNHNTVSIYTLTVIYYMPGLHSHWDSMRWDEMRWERECEGYICLVCHILNLFLSRLEPFGNISVNQSWIKGNENVSNVSHWYQSRHYILVQFLNIDCGLKFSGKCGRMKLSYLSTVSWLLKVVPVS